MEWIFWIIFLIHIIGYPLIFTKVLLSINDKNKKAIKKNLKSFLVLLLFSGFALNILPGSSIFWWPLEAIGSKIYTKNLTGKSFILKPPLKEWHSTRGFNGDGYSIEMIPLNSRLCEYFKNPDKEFFNSYPSSNLRIKWNCKKWTRTPINPEDTDEFNFAQHYINDHNIDLTKYIKEDGNFYSYLVYDHHDYIGNIDFYIISPRRKIIIIVNFNT